MVDNSSEEDPSGLDKSPSLSRPEDHGEDLHCSDNVTQEKTTNPEFELHSTSSGMNIDYVEKAGQTVPEIETEFADKDLFCVDCESDFTWSAGEQEFFRDKGLKNPPKRCRVCKKAKTERIEAATRFQENNDNRIEVKVICDNCAAETTVPFYPSQGRPVLCRSCYLVEN